jgi:hypothetical protein
MRGELLFDVFEVVPADEIGEDDVALRAQVVDGIGDRR